MTEEHISMNEKPEDGNKGKKGNKFPRKRNIKSKEEIKKKFYKIIIRKLPSNNFTENNFKECLNNVILSLNIPSENVQILHFMPGKLSRKRGPISAAGFISIDNDDALVTFIRDCPSRVQFLPGDVEDAQPIVSLAPYQKRYKAKGRIDRLSGTVSSDSDFAAFCERMKAPPTTVPSAEVQLDQREKLAATAEGKKAEKHDPAKFNPLLQFLKEKARKKQAENRAAFEKKKSLRAQSKGSGAKSKSSNEKKGSSKGKDSTAGGVSKPTVLLKKRDDGSEPASGARVVKVLLKKPQAEDGGSLDTKSESKLPSGSDTAAKPGAGSDNSSQKSAPRRPKKARPPPNKRQQQNEDSGTSGGSAIDQSDGGKKGDRGGHSRRGGRGGGRQSRSQRHNPPQSA